MEVRGPHRPKEIVEHRLECRGWRCVPLNEICEACVLWIALCYGVRSRYSIGQSRGGELVTDHIGDLPEPGTPVECILDPWHCRIESSQNASRFLRTVE